jgi:sigma-B regulation protein RsbU (phosphoserine phosphatase)
VPSIAKNFMRMFADRFRANNRAIQDALEKQRRYEYLQKELAFAYDIQLGMLPHQLNLGPTVDIATGMQPAREVGGDFFDAFPVRPDEYAVVIGDISGTGVPAALFMVRTMTLLRTELLKDQPLADAVGGLNRMLHQDNAAGMFATLVVGMFNRQTGRFDYINAGHHPVILGERGTRYRALTAPSGPRIGIDRDAAFEVASVTLDKDDVLVLHTDGITDAKNDDQETFGPDRLLACLEENSATSAGELADRINRTVHRFVAGAPQSDDMTMVIVRYPGS